MCSGVCTSFSSSLPPPTARLRSEQGASAICRSERRRTPVRGDAPQAPPRREVLPSARSKPAPGADGRPLRVPAGGLACRSSWRRWGEEEGLRWVQRRGFSQFSPLCPCTGGSGGCEPRARPPLELLEVKARFSPRRRPLGGTNFGTGWRPDSSPSCSGLHRGALPASCPTPGVAAAAPFCSGQLLEGCNCQKVAAVTVQKRLPPRGFAGASEDCCGKPAVKGWSIIQGAFGCLCRSSPWLWKDNCSQR